jgi:hypothetical protein
MPVLTLTLHAAADRMPELDALVDETISCFGDAIRAGGYPGPPRDREGELIAVSALNDSTLRLETISPLFVIQGAPFKHLLAALRYQCLRHQLPVSTDLIDAGSRAASAWGLESLESGAAVILPFVTDVCWGNRRSSLILEFSTAIDPTVAQDFDMRVRVWSRLAGCGAYCTPDQLSVFDEDVDVGVDVDLPCVGHDFIEWSLLLVGVPPDAVQPLKHLVLRADGGHRRIAAMLIG